MIFIRTGQYVAMNSYCKQRHEYTSQSWEKKAICKRISERLWFCSYDIQKSAKLCYNFGSKLAGCLFRGLKGVESERRRGRGTSHKAVLLALRGKRVGICFVLLHFALYLRSVHFSISLIYFSERVTKQILERPIATKWVATFIHIFL